MNYLLLALAGIILTILYGIILKRKPRLRLKLLGNFGDFGGDDEEQTQRQTYEYAPETLGARKSWWERLQEWGGQPGYGAVPMNWQDIWEQARKRIQQYYWGSAVSPGVIGKVRASAARRGVSESPALEELTGRMGIEEAGQYGGLATEMATKEALYGEEGRRTWLQSLMSLAGLPAIGGTQTTTTSGGGFDWFTPILQTVGQFAGQGSLTQNWMNQLLKSQQGGMPSAMQPSMTYYGPGAWGSSEPYYLGG